MYCQLAHKITIYDSIINLSNFFFNLFMNTQSKKRSWHWFRSIRTSSFWVAINRQQNPRWWIYLNVAILLVLHSIPVPAAKRNKRKLVDLKLIRCFHFAYCNQLSVQVHLKPILVAQNKKKLNKYICNTLICVNCVSKLKCEKCLKIKDYGFFLFSWDSCNLTCVNAKWGIKTQFSCVCVRFFFQPNDAKKDLNVWKRWAARD